jgi:hypothetical protein
MAETSDYDPGDWKGHDFKAAYADYDATAGRAYSAAVAAGVTASDLVPDSIETDSESPVVVLLDGTGSMGEWPKVIFSKLPYLDIEGKSYMGDTMAVSFSVFDDAHNGATDKALQVKPFVRGLELDATLKTMFLPKNGGGGGQETAELGMLFYARNCHMPKAIKPLFIVITDEHPYEFIDPDNAKKWGHVDLEKTDEKRLSTHKVVRELQRKFSVYAVIKSYNTSGSNAPDPMNDAVYAGWAKLMGEDHTVSLPDPNRVVDVIFGIMAKETGKEDYFEDELKDRQMKDTDGKKKIDVVMKSLNTIHKSVKALPGPGDAKKGASVTTRKDAGKTKKSISLLD